MNVVVVGGGTAGWITALMMQKRYPESNVSVVESSKVGILGVGESTLLNSQKIFEYIDLDPIEFIKSTKSAMKSGSYLVNWNKDNKPYFLAFSPSSNFGDHRYKKMVASCLLKEDSINKVNQSYIFGLDNRISVTEDNLLEKYKNDKNFIWKMANSWHIDARLLAQYLHNIGVERGINVIDNFVSDFVQSENGDISEIIFEDGTSTKSDFVFDCTGFQRLIIGKLFNQNFVDYSENIPSDSTIGFFLPKDEEIPPYTEVTAMNYGWMFNISLQHRIGAGYVYSSKFISDDDAKKEILDKFPDAQIQGVFKFKPGRFDKMWINNVYAIGLSGGFLEPLQSTGIHMAAQFMYDVVMYDLINNKTEKDREFLNDRYRKFYEDTRDFIQLHYITNKTNNEFWTDFKNNYKITEGVKDFLDKTKKDIVYIPDNEKHWAIDMHKVYYGNNGGEEVKDLLIAELQNQDYYGIVDDMEKNFKLRLDQYIKSKDFINLIINDKLK